MIHESLGASTFHSTCMHPIQFFSGPSRWWTEETVAVVTGANKGIGLAFAKRLTELGLTVVLTARDLDRGQAAANSLRARQLPVEFHQLDISDRTSVETFARWLRCRFGGLDILVNNAGVSFNGITENSVDHAEIVIQTNFYGSKRLIKALLPLFRRSSTSSRILNLSSQLGLVNVRSPGLKRMLEDEKTLTEGKIESMTALFLDDVKDGSWEDKGWPKVWTGYSVSKLALNAYTKLLAWRNEGRGLSVNCYCPGFTRTDMTGGQGSHTAEEAAELGAKLVMVHPDELPTGMFFKWSSKPALPSKL